MLIASARSQETSAWAAPTSPARCSRLGLVDEVRLLVNPVIVGGGKRALPDGIRLDLELLEERRFASGVVYLRYAVTG